MNPSTTNLIDTIIQKRKDAAAQSQDNTRHLDTVAGSYQTQETIVKSIKMLVEYLEKRVGKTEVTNQLREIGTPDALKVVEAVDALHETLKDQEEVDLSPVVEVMNEVLTEIKQLPKDTPELNVPDEVTVKNMVDNSADLKLLLDAIKEIKLVAEAPVVNVPAPEVKVDTDLTPLIGKMTESIKTIKQGQAKVVGGAMQTQDISGLITEKYTRFNVEYAKDDFGDEEAEKLVSKIRYYNGNILVSTLVISYDGEDVSGVKAV